MKFVDEFRNPEIAQNLLKEIDRAAKKLTRPVRLMEVCGTHTMSIFKHGIKQMLPSSLKLLSGPGCPVCVTPANYMDHAVSMSHDDDVIVCTFGDMLNVPGSTTSLAKERAGGSDVRTVYSPLDALTIAQKNPDKKIIFLAVGFETTAPTIAGTVMEARNREINNFFISSAHKLIPPAMKLLVEDSDIQVDGFICPAHVSAIIGSDAYRFLAEDYGIPCVVIGFEPLDILQGIMMLMSQMISNDPMVEIQYSRVVKKEGNLKAIHLIDEVFKKTDSRWRGLGIIPESGLALAQPFSRFDADSLWPRDDSGAKEHPGCMCGDILKGKREPEQCGLFRKTCTPESPVGPCMVSQEGTCAAHYKYGEH